MRLGLANGLVGEGPSLMPTLHMIEKENSYKLFFGLHKQAVLVCTHIYIHIEKQK